MTARYKACFLLFGVSALALGCSSETPTHHGVEDSAPLMDAILDDATQDTSVSMDIEFDTYLEDVTPPKDQQVEDDTLASDAEETTDEDSQEDIMSKEDTVDIFETTEPDIEEQDTADNGDTGSLSDTVLDTNPDDISMEDDTTEMPADVLVIDAMPIDNEVPEDPWEVELLFENVEQPSGMGPEMQKVIVQIPEGTVSVEAQIQVRGDLDNFPGAFMTFLAEDEGKLVQCSDVSGLPQKPNNILDETFRIAWPRPENLHPSSVFFPPTPPFDFKPLPCQQAFIGKSEVEIAMLGVGIFPPGQGQNQGPNACGGKGCSNDAIVKLRFISQDTLLCEPLTVTSCLCPGQDEGQKTCEEDGSGYGPCLCPEEEDTWVETDALLEDIGPQLDVDTPNEPTATCNDPVALVVGSANPIVEVTLPGTTTHQVWPGDLFNMACPTSKPPYSVETFYQMTVTDPGTVTIDVVGYDPPWEFDQYWIDIQKSCGFGGALQCGQSYEALVGEAAAGDFLISLTHAPPEEIYIPDQNNWFFTLQVVWSP